MKTSKVVEAIKSKDRSKMWSVVRTATTEVWINYKSSCVALSTLKDDYLSDENEGPTKKVRLLKFYADAMDEVGFTHTTIEKMVCIAQSKEICSIENSVAARINVSALQYIALLRNRRFAEFKMVLKKAVAKALMNRDVVTLDAVEHWVNPRKNTRTRFMAKSEFGTLSFVPKHKGATIEDVKQEIRDMLDVNALYEVEKKHIRRRRPNKK